MKILNKAVNKLLSMEVSDYSLDAMRITDSKGFVISVNNSYCILTGFDKQSIIGKSFEIEYEQKEQKELLQYYKEFISSGKINENAVKRSTFRNNKQYYLDVTYSLIEISGEKYVLSIFRDITERKQVEEKLIASETRYRRLFEAIRDGILILDSETGMILDVNQFLIDLLGYSHEAFLDKKIWEIGLFEDIIANKDHFIELAKKEYIEYKGLPLVTASGRKIEVEFVSYVYLVNGKRVIQCNIRDITERKRWERELKESEEKYRNLVENMGEGIGITDEEEKFIFVNPAGEKIFGVGKGKLNGIGLENFVTGENFEILKNQTRKRAQMETSVYELEIYLKDGSKKDIFVTATPRFENNIFKGTFGIFHDITNRKQVERDIISAKEKAEEASILKSSFLANMSHEIRTPLSGILGFTEILKNELNDPILIKYTDAIERSGNRLLETLDLILNFAKIEAEKQDINYSNVKIEELIDETIHTFDKMASIKNIYLKSIIKKENFYTKSDERFIRHILNNLVNNAIKFTNSGGVTVELSKENNNAVIKVIDTGIGILKENREIIFDEFRQESEGFGRNFEGTGLGLSITKKFVELMKGKISVESEPGRGSVFTVVLPYEDFSKSINIKLDTKETEIKNHKKNTKSRLNIPILIVEDDEENRILIETILSKYNYEFAANGYVALQKVKEKIFDLILMDINLGKGMDGIAVVNAIRKLDNYKKTPIVALTSYVLKGDKEEFLAAGCTHYLRKPFRNEQLLELINCMEIEK
jgi:PAS domain S-box-containing protein